MQDSFNFNTQNSQSFITTSFLNFIESSAFESLLLFAAANSTFVSLMFSDNIFLEICVQVKKSYGLIERRSKLKAQKYNFCNLNSFFTGNKDDEIKFLDLIKSRLPNGQSFIGIFTKNGIKPFGLYDLKTRFDASVMLDYESDGRHLIDFASFARYFFQKNTLSVSDEILNLMLLNTERTITSFTIFLEELKNFVEERKEIPNRQNFKQILLRYEQRKGT